MYHCVSFRSNKVLFLFDNADFRHRVVRIGICPKCKRTIAELIEERKVDGKLFIDSKAGVEAINFITRIRSQVDYTDELKREKNTPIGWVFGINIETKQGIKQYACDFNNKKELVKVINK